MSVSSGTDSPGQSRTKGRKMVVVLTPGIFTTWYMKMSVVTYDSLRSAGLHNC